MTIKFFLRDRNEQMILAWQRSFKDLEGVEISCGDIFDLQADAIISPANSFGFMDGGIDLAYRNFFGMQIQERLQARLISDFYGELPIGQATIIATNHSEIRYLISAPTMRIPMEVAETLNAYLAFRAAIIEIKNHNRVSSDPIESVLSPGLCTLSGRMPHERAARQMAIAYRNCALDQFKREIYPASVMNEHYRLIR